MPNHHTTMAVCSEGYGFNVDEFNERHKESNLCAIVMPMPEPIQETTVGSKGKSTQDPTGWYGWAIEKWGTKWGTYDAKAFELGGDGSPVIIKFQSAWDPPKILNKIEEWLKKTYGFEKVVWIGFDPYDNSVSMLAKEVED